MASVGVRQPGRGGRTCPKVFGQEVVEAANAFNQLRQSLRERRLGRIRKMILAVHPEPVERGMERGLNL